MLHDTEFLGRGGCSGEIVVKNMLWRKNDLGRVPLETLPENHPTDHPATETLHLRRVLGAMQWCALAFALVSGMTFVFLRDSKIGLASTVIFAFFLVAVVSNRRLRHDNLARIVVSVYAAILVSCFVVLMLLPDLSSTLALTSLLAVAFALPYTGRRALVGLMVTSCSVAIAAVIAGPLMVSQASGQTVSLFDLIFSASTLSAAVALAMLVLWQFRARLVGALEQTRMAEEQARHEATHDHLTDLPNRALLEQRLCKWLSSASSMPPFAVLFLDLDRFKYVNDSLGHHIGDEFLQVIARRLTSCIRPHEGDMVARLGGDEFVLVLGGAHLGVAEAVAARIQEALKKPVKLHGHELYTTASIGIVPDCSRYETPEEILRDTDTAMFRAKAAGRARPAVFEPSMRALAISNLRFETDLRRAVERREFVAHYQPIVWLATGGVVGFEASLHWRHPDRGLLSSKEFMPLAQESGLGYDLDQFLLDESCRKAALWRKGFPEHYPPMISVSLSADTLFRESLHDEIARTIKEAGLPGHALMIGFTEQIITENPERAVAVLEPLKVQDVRLAVDSFGSGRSSLGFLHRLPADTLKIDASFVRHIAEAGEIEGAGWEERDRAEVVRTILTVAHEFGMEVIAEGVQTREQMHVLSEMYCDYAQGPRFSRPVDADRAEAILAAEPSW